MQYRLGSGGDVNIADYVSFVSQESKVGKRSEVGEGDRWRGPGEMDLPGRGGNDEA